MGMQGLKEKKTIGHQRRGEESSTSGPGRREGRTPYQTPKAEEEKRRNRTRLAG